MILTDKEFADDIATISEEMHPAQNILRNTELEEDEKGVAQSRWGGYKFKRLN